MPELTITELSTLIDLIDAVPEDDYDPRHIPLRDKLVEMHNIILNGDS
jgi:hypothetical protein